MLWFQKINDHAGGNPGLLPGPYITSCTVGGQLSTTDIHGRPGIQDGMMLYI